MLERRRRMRNSKTLGFTLVELMVVVAVIATLGAIAIPSMIFALRAANERSASASLKTFASAQVDFKSNDRDGTRVNEFWTGDVSGLYTLAASGTTGTRPPLKLIDLALAAADSAPLAAGAAGGRYQPISTFMPQGPSAGY